MILIIGLGNPSQIYLKTRHNFGWTILDLLQKKWKEEYGFSDWEESKKFKAKTSKGVFENKTVILAKPLTFMNLSGQSVKSLIFYRKIEFKDLMVIHDDIDIPLGKIKIVKNRGTAGHKGVQSIISELGTKNFIRIRIGIKPEKGKPKDIDKFVLLKFGGKEEGIVKKITEKTVKAVETIVEKGLIRTMNEFN